MTPHYLDELAERLQQAIPLSVHELSDVQKDLAKNFRAILSSALSNLDLVPRTEFDIQAKVLAHTREKLAKLTEQVALLEKQHQ